MKDGIDDKLLTVKMGLWMPVLNGLSGLIIDKRKEL
jgi:hypothetical protein